MTTADRTGEIQSLKTAADRAMVAGDPRTAHGLFEQAIDLAADRFDLWIGLAACRRAMGDLQASLEAVDRALVFDPRSFAALLMKASLLERLGAPHQAGAAYGV